MSCIFAKGITRVIGCGSLEPSAATIDAVMSAPGVVQYVVLHFAWRAARICLHHVHSGSWR